MKAAGLMSPARTPNMGIYATVAGRYKLGGRISRRQYFFQSAGVLPIPHLHKYLTVVVGNQAAVIRAEWIERFTYEKQTLNDV